MTPLLLFLLKTGLVSGALIYICDLKIKTGIAGKSKEPAIKLLEAKLRSMEEDERW